MLGDTAVARHLLDLQTMLIRACDEADARTRGAGVGDATVAREDVCEDEGVEVSDVWVCVWVEYGRRDVVRLSSSVLVSLRA